MKETEEFPTLPTRAEIAPEKALYDWFTEQELKSADNMEAAARQIITLCTTLLGLLLGLMALAAPNLPAHMQWSGIQWLSGIGVVALLLALLCGLSVVMPLPTTTSTDPQALKFAWERLLARKRQGLLWTTLLFALAVICLAAVILIALVLL